MTDEYLNNLINTLNIKQRKEHIFIQRLDRNVDLAKVFTDRLHITDNLNTHDLIADIFYCIKSDNQYIGIVYDMNKDLHWFVKKEYRGNGYLTKALKSCIFPHIFQNGREEQRITINKNEIGKTNFESSQKVAINLGFILEHNNKEKYEYILKSDKITEIDLFEHNNELTKGELKVIANEIGYYTKKLKRIQTHLDMNYNNEEIFMFGELIKKLRNFAIRIEYI